MVRIYALIIILAILGSCGYGVYLYYKDTQQRIATLRENTVKLETSNKSLTAQIEAMKQNAEKQAKLSKELQDNLEKARKANTVIKDLLAKTDLVKNSLADPLASEKRINEEIDTFFGSIESATK
jgi:cell division protein FtsB